jgi:hypothetical protein
MTPQDRKVLDHLSSGKTLTQLEAFGVYGIFRLGARVWSLKQDGYKITSRRKVDANGKPYAEYALNTNAGRRS